MGIRSLSTASISTGTKRSKVWDQSAVYTPTSYESIAAISVTTGTDSIQFASIPSTYTHLQVRFIAQSTVSSNYAQSLAVTFNGDTGANYSRHFVGGYTGGYSATSAAGDASQSRIDFFGGFTSANFNSSMFGAGILDVLDYGSTVKYKTGRLFAGGDGNTSSTLVSTVGLSSGLWRSTAAITSIELRAGNGQIAAGSKFALYGIKG